MRRVPLVESERAVEPRSIISFKLSVPMSREDDYEAELADEIDTNLAALEYSLKLCRDHRTYVGVDPPLRLESMS